MKYPMFVLLSILSIASLSVCYDSDNVIFEWKYVDFVWESPQQKEEAIKSGNYNASACVLYDVDCTQDGRTFVTVVREQGVPASLMTVSTEIGEGGPLLRPYPDWSWYKNGSCDGITSVYRVYIKCDFLFVLDCGQIGNDQVCPAQLLIFNLSTNILVKRVIIPSDVATNQNGSGLLVTPVVFAPHCENITNTAIVFMADILGYGLVVWDAHTSEFCRIESDSMKPANTTFDIEGQTFSLDDGILGMTLAKEYVYRHNHRYIYRHKYRHFPREYLYYAPLAGTEMYKMDILELLEECPRNSTKAGDLTQLAGTLTGQTAPIASKDCAIFFGNIPETAIMCADTSKEINSGNRILMLQLTIIMSLLITI